MADERLGMVMVVEVDHTATPERPRSRTVSVCAICERVLVWVIDEEDWAHVGAQVAPSSVGVPPPSRPTLPGPPEREEIDMAEIGAVAAAQTPADPTR